MTNFDERFVIDTKNKKNIIYNEHLVRYELAKQLVKDKIVLDIACGSGYGAKIMAQAGAKQVIAIDIDKETIKEAQKNKKEKNLKYKIGNAQKIDFENEKFDIITSFETIEHLQQPSKYLKELSRIIKKDGIILISTPNKEVYKEKNPYHYREYTEQEFKNELSAYFPNIKIFYQKNGLVSFIGNNNKKIIAKEPTRSKALYFIAICSYSNEKLKKIDFQPIGSINSQALEEINNNPGWKLINKIYSLIIKIPGMKKILSSRAER